jgi:hypothetical protein
MGSSFWTTSAQGDGTEKQTPKQPNEERKQSSLIGHKGYPSRETTNFRSSRHYDDDEE